MSEEELLQMGARAAERWAGTLALLAEQEADERGRAIEYAEALMLRECR